jgi:hypothetical protein
MPQSPTFREVTSDEDASFLLPGNDDHLHIVLFCDAGAPAVQKARQLAPKVDIPAEWDLVLFDPDDAPETAKWFGVDERSGMAVIGHGSLLDIEYECSLSSFKRLIDVAKRQADSLGKLG